MRNAARLEALAERQRAILARGAGHTSGPSDRGPRSGWSITAATASPRTTVRVYGYIGDSWWDDGVTASQFAQDLEGIGTDGIDLHLNSGGGSVFDAIAMHAALLNHPSDVHAYVDGIAASAASFLAMAGDEIIVEKPARMMIHNASGLVLGNRNDMRDMADLLEELDGTIAEIYADRSGRPVAGFLEAMNAETWYTSSQAVEAGLADRVANDRSTAAPEDRAREQRIRARARVTLGRGQK